jgi:hypothetical protein
MEHDFFFEKIPNWQIQKNLKKYQDIENNLYYSHGKNHVKISCILASGKKVKIVDLAMNSAILNGPPYSKKYMYLSFLLCPKYKVFFFYNLQICSARHLLHVDIFFKFF